MYSSQSCYTSTPNPSSIYSYSLYTESSVKFQDELLYNEPESEMSEPVASTYSTGDQNNTDRGHIEDPRLSPLDPTMPVSSLATGGSNKRLSVATPKAPPPLPKRNSILVPATENSLYYGPDGQLKLYSGSNQSSLSRQHIRLRKASLPTQLSSLSCEQLSSLMPPQLVTHELTRARRTPFSEEGRESSLILESKAYVREIQQRRDNIHRTLLRGANPGHKLRWMLGYRLEQRLVRALSRKRGSRKFTRSPPVRARKRYVQSAANRPRHLLQRMRRQFKMAAGGGSDGATEWPGPEDEYGEIEHRSRGSTPCLIVDKTGTLRWPSNKSTDLETHRRRKVLDSDNFTLRNPSTEKTSSPSILGWLQVKPDSHVFTPAVEDPNGPFRKVPFHPHLHVLKTKI